MPWQSHAWRLQVSRRAVAWDAIQLPDADVRVLTLIGIVCNIASSYDLTHI